MSLEADYLGSRLPRKSLGLSWDYIGTISGLSREYIGSISGLYLGSRSRAQAGAVCESCVCGTRAARAALKEARVSKMSDVAIRHFRNVSRGLVMVRPCGTGVRNCNQRPSYKDLGTGKLGIRAAKRGRAESCWCGVNLVFPLASQACSCTRAPPSSPP
jgi:hypothetical protein